MFTYKELIAYKILEIDAMLEMQSSPESAVYLAKFGKRWAIVEHLKKIKKALGELAELVALADVKDEPIGKAMKDESSIAAYEKAAMDLLRGQTRRVL